MQPVPIQNTASPRAQFFVKYWDSLRQGRAAPAKRDIDPNAIEHLLGDVILIDRSEEGAFTVRLAGERLRDVWGRDLRGHLFTGLFVGPDRKHASALLESSLEESLPCLAYAQAESCKGQEIGLNYVFAPLLAANGKRSCLIALCETRGSMIGFAPIARQWFTSIHPPHRSATPASRPDHLRLIVQND